MINVLIPIAGESPFFPESEYHFPKPLTEVAGKMMIERVVENLSTISNEVRFIFVVSEFDVAKFSLDRTLRLITGGNCETVVLKKPTKGALCSCLMAIEHIDKDIPLIISNGDQIIDENLNEIVSQFSLSQSDAGVISFDSVHPRWSYVLKNRHDIAVRFAEKTVISKCAIAGFYYFATGNDFIQAAEMSLLQGDEYDGAYYVAPSLNQLLLRGRKVAVASVLSEKYHSFFSPSKIKDFENLLIRNSIESLSQETDLLNSLTIVIPAAGEGSRFQSAGYSKRKPFIDVNGKPMVEYVLDNLRTLNCQPVLLFRESHINEETRFMSELEQNDCKIVKVKNLTEGTACTVMLARQYFDSESPLLVANSDQYVEFDCSDFVNDCISRNLDGSILVFREDSLDPKWSFAKTDNQGLVVEVAEKEAISNLATVGIYFFRRGSDFVRAAADMFAMNDRINGEFYTCPVYNYMIKQGLRIGIYEIPRSSMHGLGTPDDLNKFLLTGIKN